MQVSILAAFVAGLISFLSPCVLPLVPGYISMLSGIGVEQLRRGEKPRGSLVASSVAFVCGLSVVFIAFGASASAVGKFLASNRTLLTPFAGALVILFGLHLLGVLGKIDVVTSAIMGGALLVAAAYLLGRHGTETAGPWDLIGATPFAAVSIIFLAGPSLTRWLNRDLHFRQLGGAAGDADAGKAAGPLAGVTSGFLLGFAFAFGWTPCIGPILTVVLGIAATQATIAQGDFPASGVFGGTRDSILADGRRHQRFPAFLPAIPEISARRRVGERRVAAFVGGLIFLNRLTWLSGKLGFLNVFLRRS